MPASIDSPWAAWPAMPSVASSTGGAVGPAGAAGAGCTVGPFRTTIDAMNRLTSASAPSEISFTWPFTRDDTGEDASIGAVLARAGAASGYQSTDRSLSVGTRTIACTFFRIL